MPSSADLDVLERALRERLRINLRARRNAAGLTLKKAAEQAEIHWRHWQKIEAGEINITLHTLSRIARVLNADEAELLGEPCHDGAASGPKPRSPAGPRHQLN